MPRPLRLALLGLAATLALLLVLLYGLAWRPAERAPATFDCEAGAALLQPGQALTVLTWNLDAERPPSQDEMVRVLRDEQADIVLLQALQDGAGAQQERLALLRERLGALYPCASQAFVWKTAVQLQPASLAGVALKLATLSRYRIASAERVQLPRRPGNPLLQPFAPQPALLVSQLPLRGGGRLAAINSQLDAAVPGDDTLRRQLDATLGLLEPLQAAGAPWLLGGDLDRRPPAQARRRDAAAGRELNRLAARYPMIARPESAAGGLGFLLHSPHLTPLDTQMSPAQAHRPRLVRLLLPALD
ncbi:endonuclease/exonuclease/phosphatase family protein [Pseudomonas lalucatii]|uniref:Endonuclease/exonuclease/phosphatase family protein n=1 Tax=Pseudomonas lalucatii TaxID=1424203 RepID=A0ABS5Q6S7_9PSED|nr:endonuclease/exonuclease/phosphatase family protein [Pseudomonas lalucatii]